MKQSEKLLGEHNIQATDVRIKVLEAFKKSKNLLTSQDINNKYSNSIDRITLFRTLQLFLEKKILNRVADTTGTVYYDLNEDGKTYFYFKCLDSNKVTRLQEVQTPNLPKKYKGEEFNFLIQGQCK